MILRPWASYLMGSGCGVQEARMEKLVQVAAPKFVVSLVVRAFLQLQFCPTCCYLFLSNTTRRDNYIHRSPSRLYTLRPHS